MEGEPVGGFSVVKAKLLNQEIWRKEEEGDYWWRV